MIAEIPQNLSWNQASVGFALCVVVGIVIGIFIIDWIRAQK